MKGLYKWGMGMDIPRRLKRILGSDFGLRFIIIVIIARIIIIVMIWWLNIIEVIC